MVGTLPAATDNGDAETAEKAVPVDNFGGLSGVCGTLGGVNGVGERGQGSAGGSPMPQVPGLVMLRRLGMGGQGEVWLAADLATGERVAVKVRSGPSAADDDERWAREIAVLRRIDHPHVVRMRRIIDVPGGGRALVMDLAVGGSLADLVGRRGPLEPAEACTTLVPLAQTLAELHGRGLVHGDLSPSNVLFTENGRPMIADLGCAVVLGGRQVESWGSDGYCDPARSGPAEPGDDVFALGALLRFALTGRAESGRPGVSAGSAGEALLALAARCTSSAVGARPTPDDVARAALGAVEPAPVRLEIPADERTPRRKAAETSGRSASPELVDTQRKGRTDGVVAGPRPRGGVPARVQPSAAARGWTRPTRIDQPDVAPAPTSELPVTRLDLPLDAAVGRFAGTATVTRRRTPAPSDATASQRTGSSSMRSTPRASRPPQHERRTAAGRLTHDGSATGVRSVPLRRLLAAVALLFGVGGGWLLLSGDGADVAPAVSAAPGDSEAPSSAVPSSPVVPTPVGSAQRSTWVSASAVGDGREPLPDAVKRLAEGRAYAFEVADPQALAAVDEPGSSAMADDTGLIGRLRAQGVRLAGLTFRISAVRVVSTPSARAGPAVVEAIVVTSSHRQVGMVDGAVRASVTATPSRRIRLTLVLAPDARHWLVRSATPGQGAVTG